MNEYTLEELYDEENAMYDYDIGLDDDITSSDITMPRNEDDFEWDCCFASIN